MRQQAHNGHAKQVENALGHTVVAGTFTLTPMPSETVELLLHRAQSG
jgi:hypothetical protein